MNTRTVLRCAALGAALALVGCSNGTDLSRTFGLTRDSPDEFTVTTRAPLSMPPDFTLRPPQPGAARPQEQSTTDSAQVTIAGSSALAPAPSASGSDPGLDALLTAAGPPAPADIRAKVDAEALSSAHDHDLANTLMFWKTPALPGTPLDAKAEADRLHDNAALGNAPDTGETPIIQKKPQGILEGLF